MKTEEPLVVVAEAGKQIHMELQKEQEEEEQHSTAEPAIVVQDV